MQLGLKRKTTVFSEGFITETHNCYLEQKSYSGSPNSEQIASFINETSSA